MNARQESSGEGEPGLATGIVLGLLSLLWHSVRIPVLVVLRLAEPLVWLLLSAFGLLSILMALFYAFLTTVPHRPFLPLLGFGIACGVGLLLYEALLRLFSR
jgi:hypothetical protein